MRAACEVRPLETPVYIWNPALIFIDQRKPPAFKQGGGGATFIQTWYQFEEIQYKSTKLMAKETKYRSWEISIVYKFS